MFKPLGGFLILAATLFGVLTLQFQFCGEADSASDDSDWAQLPSPVSGYGAWERPADFDPETFADARTLVPSTSGKGPVTATADSQVAQVGYWETTAGSSPTPDIPGFNNSNSSTESPNQNPQAFEIVAITTTAESIGNGQEYKWTRLQPNEVLLLKGTSFKVQFKEAVAKDVFVVKPDGSRIDGDVGDPQTSTTWQVSELNASTTYTLQTTGGQVLLYLRTPSSPGTVPLAKLEYVSNIPGFEVAWRQPASESVNVYGNLIKLVASFVNTPALDARALSFELFDSKTGFVGYRSSELVSQTVNANNLVEATYLVSLPPEWATSGRSGKLLALYVQGNESFQNSDPESPLQLTVNVSANPFTGIGAPSIAAIHKGPTPINNQEVPIVPKGGNQFRTNGKDFIFSGSFSAANFQSETGIVVSLTGERGNVRQEIVKPGNDGQWRTVFTAVADGSYTVTVHALLGTFESARSSPIQLTINNTPPAFVGFDPPDKTIPLGPIKFRILYGNQARIDPASLASGTFNVGTANGSEVTRILNPGDNSIEIQVAGLNPEGGTLDVTVSGLTDEFGNEIAAIEHKIQQTGEVGIPAMVRGVPENNAPFVQYPEFTDPRPRKSGFNPSDKVETRVTRLYYFRDAHRVAQIINRQTRSYNRQDVSQSQQAADMARGKAMDAQNQRQLTEQNAIVLAQDLREAENRLRDLQNQLVSRADAYNSKLRELNRLEETQRANGANPDPELEKRIQRQQESLALERETVERFSESGQRSEETVLNKRAQLNQSNELLLRHGQDEERARAEQFRLEVAAAHTDPDTYAPGNPDSEDPVAQVSISVIGEGLIQLRGPIKGVNIVRKMIHEIDSPVGQARISMHTVQINGDQGDRMEVVADRIQKYVDHARFLTAQSSEMLRKSVTIVAARKAEECQNQFGNLTQPDRDLRYLDAFFGADFIQELRTMDSEFLKTGNKVLSLHSMDSTSLAHAMFLMALAKNGTRLEILQEFEDQLATVLPQSEQNFFEAGSGGCLSYKKHHFGKQKCDFVFLSQNARFESLKGLFDVGIQGDETLSPLQREFIRLAQIFKSQLVTEMEYQQRVRERAIIEERMGDPAASEKLAFELEANAKNKERELQDAIQGQIAKVAALIGELSSEAQSLANNLSPLDIVIGLPTGDSQRSIQQSDFTALRSIYNSTNLNQKVQMFGVANSGNLPIPDFSEDAVKKVAELYRELETLKVNLNANINVVSQTGKDYLAEFEQLLQNVSVEELRKEETFEWGCVKLYKAAFAGETIGNHVRNEILKFQVESNRLYFMFTGIRDLESLNDALALGVQLRSVINEQLKPTGKLGGKILKLVAIAEEQSTGLAQSMIQLDFARRQAAELRRPLDHKKFLDMLIDDLEDKYVELLEGTRAQIANVDNYLKRVSTALETDFDVQFYRPAFSCIRQSSQYWDVELGQVETSTILANNRQFAKVSPQATFEFDLPRRDILVNEAMSGALAAVDAYGALVTDPNFLALASLNSGQPTGSSYVTNGLTSPVRDVLPGLPTSTQEQMLLQSGPGNSRFNAAFESLIPDPAIYKFETGTGYEIRPVIQPDGQAVVYHLNYMYTTNVREPVRPDEKHLGRVKRHFIDTDVQLSNYELREVSRYQVALKAARTARGVPLLEGIPVAGVLFRPLPSQESALQQNVILSQATIFPTLFDLMGLRWAPAVSDLDSLRLASDEFTVRQRRQYLDNRVYDHSSSQVDEFLRIPDASRRADLYRSQETIPRVHPNGYRGNGLDMHEAPLQEGYQIGPTNPQQFVPGANPEGVNWRQNSTEGHSSGGLQSSDYPTVEYSNGESYAPDVQNQPTSNSSYQGGFMTQDSLYENISPPFPEHVVPIVEPDPRFIPAPGYNPLAPPSGSLPHPNSSSRATNPPTQPVGNQ